MLEVEIKFRVADFADLETRLIERGAHFSRSSEEIDQYFNAPDRDFARTDEALRLRRIGSENFVTYKGPKLDALSKTRTEIEVPLQRGQPSADAFTALLGQLGYRPVREVSKLRRIYELEEDGFVIEVCLDEIQSLGKFAELEIVAPEDQLEIARSLLLRIARDLGLAQSERRSYLELLLAAQGDKQA
ncbi:MAG TPA: class IV adenylate cyclase [Gemmataceae bacterium]|nr:class IV adenylate cyclase [Gemmataceae bacterium]